MAVLVSRLCRVCLLEILEWELTEVKLFNGIAILYFSYLVFMREQYVVTYFELCFFRRYTKFYGTSELAAKDLAHDALKSM